MPPADDRFHQRAPRALERGHRSLSAPRFSIVIPLHNEVGYLAEAAGRLLDDLAEVPEPIELLMVENGSTDGTLEVAHALASQHAEMEVLSLPAADYGAALREGFLAARGDWVVSFDIDYFSVEFLNRLRRLDGRADLILASKLAPGSIDQRPGLRRLGTRVFNLLLRGLFGSRVSDTHGIKALRRQVVQELAPQVISTQDLFDTELVLLAERAGYRIAEVPATVVELRQTRSSLIRRVPRTLLGLWRMRRRLSG